MAAEQPGHTIAMFGNDLIFDHLAEYLGIPDLKILRQTCKFLYSKVNGNRKFISNLRLTILDETIQENGMCDSITWENVSIVVNRTSSQHFQNIRTDYIEDLKLLHHTSEELTEFTDDKNSSLAFYELLEVKKFPNLRSMTLDLNLMCYDIPMAAMASVVGTVKEFRFQGVGMYDEFCPKDEEGRIAENNLKKLGGLPWELYLFAIEGLRLSQRISAAVGAIPASSASTLQELKLCSVQFKRETNIYGVRFPQLKRLGLKIARAVEYNYKGVFLAEFLHLQPQLEAIEINCNLLDDTYEKFAPSVLEAIRRTCSSKLHTLRLWGAVWFKSFPDFESWAFIRDLTALKNVTICDMCRSNNVVAQILTYLPSRTQSLEMDYFKYDIAAPVKLAALTSFLDLVQLKLSNPVLDACCLIDDAILQAICRSLIKLRVLHFGAEDITDFGLTGERGNYNSGISLRNLKGLQDLVMPMCYGITEDGILKAIKFLELRRLELTTRTLSKSAIVEIASRNPSLEYVFCYIVIGRDHQDFKEYILGLFSSILAVNPRLTLIRSTDVYFTGIGDKPDYAICRPSYGVSTSLADTTTLAHIRNTMKVAKSSKTPNFKYTYTYYYNIPSSTKIPGKFLTLSKMGVPDLIPRVLQWINITGYPVMFVHRK